MCTAARPKFLFLIAVVSILISHLLTPAAFGVEPADGVQLGVTQVRLDWTDVLEPGIHDVQLAQVGGAGDPFDSPIIDERVDGGSLLVEEGIVFGAAYQWRVRSVQDGVPQEWSLLSNFSTVFIPLAYELSVQTQFGQTPPQPGVTVFNHCDSVVGFNLEGEQVLFVETQARVGDVKIIPGGRLLHVGGGQAWILNFAGEVLWVSPDSDDFRVHHCASIMPNGNVMLLLRDYRDITQDGVTRQWQGDRIVEMNIDTNEIVWEWATFDNYTTDDYDVFQTNHWNDWTHVNNAHYEPADNSVYISSRHLSRITRIDYDTKEIVYNMGMDMPSGDVTVGDDLFSYQHSPQLLPNGNLMLFDNGNRRGGQPAGNGDGRSFAIEVELSGDPLEEASIVWSWETPTYCPSTGDADRLENGNTLVTSTQLLGMYEVDPQGEIAWNLEILSTESCGGLRPGYRSTRIPNLYLEDIQPPCEGDLDGDDQVAVDDILELLSQWGGSGSADLDQDGQVAVDDVLLMLQNWGACD